MENLTENQLRAKIAQKLAKISSLMNSIQMDGTNKFSNYSYISYEQINAYLSRYMLKENLMIIPGDYEIISKERYKTRKGDEAEKVTIKCVFDIIDCETGYQITKIGIGSGADNGDKALPKAITEVVKRFYAKLFSITSKGEIDPDSETIERSKDQLWLRKKLTTLSRETGRGTEIKEILEAEGIQNGNPDLVDYDHQVEIYNLVYKTLNSNL